MGEIVERLRLAHEAHLLHTVCQQDIGIGALRVLRGATDHAFPTRAQVIQHTLQHAVHAAAVQRLHQREQQQLRVAGLAAQLPEGLAVLEEEAAGGRVVLLRLTPAHHPHAVELQQRVHHGPHHVHGGQRVEAVVAAHVLPLQLGLRYASGERRAPTQLQLLQSASCSRAASPESSACSGAS